MGEGSEPLTTSTARLLSHRGILLIMGIVVAIAAAAGFAFGGPGLA